MKSKGFTIIENIISLFLLCIISSSFLTVAAFNMTAMHRASNAYEQVNHIEEVMDELIGILNNYEGTTAELDDFEDFYSKQGIKIEIKPSVTSKVFELSVWDEKTSTALQTLVLMQ